MKLILVRHGETPENRRRILQGQTHGRLTAEGVSQANQLADSLAGTPIAACFTSDLRRAVDTARIIATKHCGLTVVEDTRLRERHLGQLQGQPMPDNWNGTEPYEGAEPMAELYKRVNSFLSYLRLHHAGETVLIVSHGITLKVLISVCLGYDERQFEQMDVLKNGSAKILEVSGEAVNVAG